MAFSFSNAVSKEGAGPMAKDGREMVDIETDELGLPGVNGEVKLKLLSQSWPEDSPPPPTASLLAVASQLGLIAAAGPEELVVTSTDKIRAAFLESFDKSRLIRDFEPTTRIARSRLAHVVFTADESVLAVSAQNGGGIDAYRVSDLGNARATPAAQISTEGKALRALVPNPSPEPDVAGLMAVVTVDGELLIADIRQGSIRPGVNGPILQDRVSCVSWSSKGKQLVAGLADGTAVQLKPDGTVAAAIPKTTAIADGSFITAISWLQNDKFLAVYCPQDTEGPPPQSEFYIITREPKTTNFTFDKLPEAVALFGKDRLPTHYFMHRLRDFPPHLKELIVVAATSSADIGLIAKSDKPLSNDNVSAEDFCVAVIADNGRRAALPMTDAQIDTSPVGMAIDYSSKEPVLNPILTEPDIIESPNPVPQLLVLNDQGLLCSWWIVYNDSVKEKTPYPGMDMNTAGSLQTISSPSTTPSQSQPQAQPAQPTGAFAAPTATFGQKGFGSAPTAPAASGFGAGSGFGSTGGSSFGKASAIGGASSSWTSTGFGASPGGQAGSSGFGQPAFGSSSAIGGNKAPAFGSASSMGQPTAAPTFGSSGFAGQAAFGKNTSGASSFGGASGSATSGFSSFSKQGGFAGFASKDTEKAASPFGQAASGGFGGFSGSKDQQPASPFGQSSGNTKSAFGNPSTTPSSGAFGGFGKSGATTAAQPFGPGGGLKLNSSFKGDSSAKDDFSKPTNGGSGFGFGSNLDDMLGDTQKGTSPTHDREEEMSEGSATEKSQQPAANSFAEHSSATKKEAPKTLVTPPSSIGQPKATPAPPVSNLFGRAKEPSTTPQPPPPASTGWSFGHVASTTPNHPTASFSSTTPKETPTPSASIFEQKQEPASVPFEFGKPKTETAPAIKRESSSDDGPRDLSKIPEAPLPPDTVSKPRYVTGESSASSSNSRSTEQFDDAPLPPSWTPANKTATLAAEPSGLPSDEEDDLSEFDESGEDLEGEVGDDASSEGDQHADDRSDQLQTSPESSFKGGERSAEASPTGGVFTKVTNTSQAPRPLFGEVGTTGPIFPPPKPQQSPRSPSPVRHLQPADRLRSEASRSVSAPAHPRSAIDQRKSDYVQSGLANRSVQAQQQELTRQKQQQEQLAQGRQQAEALELQGLQDDEDEQLRRELSAPIKPSDILDDFMSYQAKAPEEGVKSGVPAQIERLYKDINSMVDTLGINSRSLAAYMLYQQEQKPNENWPDILSSETPADTLNDDWYLGDIPRLREGLAVLDQSAQELQVEDVDGKLQDCQKILSQDIADLRTKLATIRKTLNARNNPDETLVTPLSAEQTSTQHDLRKMSVSVQSKLIRIEDALSVLRARLAETALSENGKKPSVFGPAGQKKPTVEAVTNTVLKMTKMAEQKSADIDMLESQLRRLDVKGNLDGSRHGTPNGTPNPRRSTRNGTPGSSGSVYHTPGSKFGGSTRSPASRSGANGSLPVISIEDKEKWQAKARRKKEVAALLKDVLEERKGHAKA